MGAISKVLTQLVFLVSAVAATQGRIKSLFNLHPQFNEELLIKVFREKPTEEFLLTHSNALLGEMLQEFSDWIEYKFIGEPTLEGRHIEVISFKHQPEWQTVRSSAVLFDGAHHSRELITIKMTHTILLKLLHGVHHNDAETLQTIQQTQVFVIPIVNVDGVAFIEANEFGDGKIPLKRKNARVSGKCNPVDDGVDLNRNYDVSWSATKDMRDDNPCSQSFRGPEPWSEPETRTMRDFILENAQSLKFIVNYHSFGNMFLIPFQGKDEQHKLSKQQAKIYDEIKTEATFPPGMISGNAKQLLNYYANGEASDWALAKAGVIAMSPELASESALSFTFDIPSVRVEARVIMENLGLPFYLLDKASPQIMILEAPSNKAIMVDLKKKKVQLELRIENKGMSDATNLTLVTKFNDVTNLATTEIKLDKLASRSYQTVKITLSKISDDTLETLDQALMYNIDDGRVGLNFDFEVAYDGVNKAQTSGLYVPISSQQLTGRSWNYFISLMELDVETEDSETVVKLQVYQVGVIVALFILIGHGLSWLCHRRENEVSPEKQPNYYDKIDKVVLQLDDDEKLSQVSRSGPDYVQF